MEPVMVFMLAVFFFFGRPSQDTTPPPPPPPPVIQQEVKIDASGNTNSGSIIIIEKQDGKVRIEVK